MKRKEEEKVEKVNILIEVEVMLDQFKDIINDGTPSTLPFMERNKSLY